MISEQRAKELCKDDISKIENYEDAVNDKTQTWICHHILGEILSREQLIDHDFYYKVPSCMLKFVTLAEHNRIHHKDKPNSKESRMKVSESLKGHTSWSKGKHLSSETRSKISEAMKGSNNPMYGHTSYLKGKHLSEETKRKISESRKGRTSPMKGKKLSEEHRKKLSESHKGKKKGVKFTEEHRRKISDAQKRRWASIKK